MGLSVDIDEESIDGPLTELSEQHHLKYSQSKLSQPAWQTTGLSSPSRM
jgi:hypothetical protein